LVSVAGAGSARWTDPVRSLRDPRLLLVTAVALALFAPLTRVDWFWGDERTSYILRTVEWASELRAGKLYPRWCSDFYGGYGSPLFMFYGPVIYGLAGVLTASVTDAVHALKVVGLLGWLAAGWGTYAWALVETRQKDAALLASLAFLATPYVSGNLYARGDFGEFSCLALMPAVLALYRASAFEPRPLRARRLAVAASVSHALFIMTHPVLGLWGTLVIGVVLAVTLLGLVRRSRRRTLELLLALSSAPLLAGLYVVPALIDRKATHTANMVKGFYDPRQHWLGFGDFFDASGYKMVGPLVALASAAVLLGLALNFRRALPALGWLALALALLALNLPQMSWFWAPNRLPLVEFIQFPWRLLGPIALVSSMALAVASAALFERVHVALRFGAALLVSIPLLVFIAWPHVGAGEMLTGNVPREPESVRAGLGSATDADEYLPLAVPAPPTAPRTALVASASGAAVEFESSDASRHAVIVRSERAGAEVTLALHAFPGWQLATAEGPAEAKLSADARGLMLVRLPVAGHYRLELHFGASTAARVGYAITGLGVLLLLLLLVFPERDEWRRRLRGIVSARSVPGV